MDWSGVLGVSVEGKGMGGGDRPGGKQSKVLTWDSFHGQLDTTEHSLVSAWSVTPALDT